MILRNRTTKKLERVFQWDMSSEAFDFATEVFGKGLYKGKNKSLCTPDNSVIIELGSYMSESKIITQKPELFFKNPVSFTKKSRSTFPYWFSHWCAFQLCALSIGAWKFRYLFHDAEKPWLKLFWDYKRVQAWHRKHNRHHLEYGLLRGWDKLDVEALVIDWECSAYTKAESQLDASETLEYEISREEWAPYKEEIEKRIKPILQKYDL